jgi:hypothetical protein
MRFHIITTISRPTGYILDTKTKPEMELQGRYLVDTQTGAMFEPIASSDDYIGLMNDLLDMKVKALENKLSEEYYAKRKQSY